MLETLPHITHERCVTEAEARYNDRAFSGHESITELELCRDLADWEDAAAKALGNPDW
jgi:hypothetical protein